MEQQFFVRTQQKFLTSAKPFETEGPGATWADIMIKWKLLVIGSVYINVGKIGEIEILEQVVQKMHAKHKHMIILGGDTIHEKNYPFYKSCHMT